MQKGLFSKNRSSKILVTSIIIALTVSSHISSLSVVHAESNISTHSVSAQNIDTTDNNDDNSSDNPTTTSTPTASPDTKPDTDNSDKNKSDKKPSKKKKNHDKKKKSVTNRKKHSSRNKNNQKEKKPKDKKTNKKDKTKNKKKAKNKEPEHFKPIIGRTVTVTIEHIQKKLDKISSDIKKTQYKEYRTKRVLNSKRKQLSSINTIQSGHKENANVVSISSVFEPSQSLKSYAKQYDSSLSIYLTQEVSSSQTATAASGSSILPDFEKISSLMDTVSIKHSITNSKKCIKSDIDKNRSKIKIIHKKINSQKKLQQSTAKYVVVSINTKNIFEPSNVTTGTLKKALEGTNLEELAPAFVKAEKKYGINAIAMTSIAALESGWGKSKRAVNDNNLTGLGVYSNSAKGINANTKEKNILMTAERLSTHYSKAGQMYYNGTGFDGVNRKYSASKTWGWKCENIAFRIMNKIANPGIEPLA